jgi:hypothetical protein
MSTINENAVASHPSTQTNEPAPVPIPDPRTSASSTVRMIDPYDVPANQADAVASGQ